MNSLKKVKFLLLLALVWELLAVLISNPLKMPRLEDLWRTFVADMASGELFYVIFHTFTMVLGGLVLALFLSAMVLYVYTNKRASRPLLKSLVSSLHPLPGIALLPLLILWLGIGNHVILLLLLHGILWPMLTSSFSGYDQMPLLYQRIGKNHELGPLSTYAHLTLPFLTPHLISGLRIGLARGFRTLIASELFFSSIGNFGGLGHYLMNKRLFLDTPGLYIGLLVIMILGYLFENVLFAPLEKWGEKFGGHHA